MISQQFSCFRKAWKALGNLSQEEAQAGVIKLLEETCPQLKEIILEEARQKQGER